MANLVAVMANPKWETTSQIPARARIDADDVSSTIVAYNRAQAELAPEEKNANPKNYYFLHVSSYPNENVAFYRCIWKYLNRPNGTTPGTALQFRSVKEKDIKWKYIHDQTQDYFCTKPLTKQEASDERKRIKGELAALAKRLNIDETTGGKKGVDDFRINVLVTEAVEYDVIEDLAAEFDLLFNHN